MTPINPYITGDPVGNSPIFVGRDNILREVLKVLSNPNQNAITLYGQRRIGKTSVLQFLQVRLPQEGGFQTVYFDLQDKSEWPLPRILLGLANAILDRLNLPIPIPSMTENLFIEWLQSVLASLPADTSIVILFDEFDVLADSNSGNAAADFFLYLGKLLTLDPARLKFVLVLGRNFTDLGTVALSTFKGIPSRRISLLPKSDTLKLVRLSEQGKSLYWSSKSAEMVWSLTHGHPYLTQALCSQVWEMAFNETPNDAPQVTPEMVEAAVDATLDTSRNTLEWLWTGLGPAEKVISAALSGAGNQVVDELHLAQILRESGVRILIRELQNAPELLKSWDILEPVSGGYVFRVEILRRWIERYHSLKRTQDELDRIQPAADSLFQAAQAFYAQGDLTEAENLLKQAIGVNPNHIRANELLAETLIGLGRLNEARDLLERSFEMVPNNARPRLIQVCLDQAQVEPDDKVRLKLYERVLELDSSRPEALSGVEKIRQAEKDEQALASEFINGRQALQRGEWDRAIEFLQNVVASQPSYSYESDTAADLLAKAVREKEHPISFRQIWLRQFWPWSRLWVTRSPQAKSNLVSKENRGTESKENGILFYISTDSQPASTLVTSKFRKVLEHLENGRAVFLISAPKMGKTKLTGWLEEKFLESNQRYMRVLENISSIDELWKELKIRLELEELSSDELKLRVQSGKVVVLIDEIDSLLNNLVSLNKEDLRDALAFWQRLNNFMIFFATSYYPLQYWSRRIEAIDSSLVFIWHEVFRVPIFFPVWDKNEIKEYISPVVSGQRKEKLEPLAVKIYNLTGGIPSFVVDFIQILGEVEENNDDISALKQIDTQRWEQAVSILENDVLNNFWSGHSYTKVGLTLVAIQTEAYAKLSTLLSNQLSELVNYYFHETIELLNKLRLITGNGKKTKIESTLLKGRIINLIRNDKTNKTIDEIIQYTEKEKLNNSDAKLFQQYFDLMGIGYTEEELIEVKGDKRNIIYPGFIQRVIGVIIVILAALGLFHWLGL